jgi:dihydrofolate reductase
MGDDLMISLISAMDNNRLIGKDNFLPWGKLPADMRHFRAMTEGNIVVMGRKTFDSLGRKPLPNRKNIILSRELTPRNYEYYFDDNEKVIITRNTDLVTRFANSMDIFIIGGEDVYKQFINMADYIHMTQIDGEFEGDTHFPEIDYRDWFEISTNHREADKDNPYNMTFRTLKRLS